MTTFRPTNSSGVYFVPIPATIVRDAAKAARREKEHLVFKSVG